MMCIVTKLPAFHVYSDDIGDDGDNVYGDGDRTFTNLNSGQIYPSAFPEMLRVVRPGGYILIAMKVNK